MKQLYFGDCLDILKTLHAQRPEGFIDLIYIDPPYNSKRDYNILFESHDIIGDDTAQKQAFADTWSNVSYLDELNEIQNINLDLYQFLKNLDNIRVSKSAVSYLTTMAIRIYYIRRTLKDTGSFYLHCDSRMSHYLKIVCDLIYGENNFRNEIRWKRQPVRGAKATSHQFARNSDNILFYTKAENAIWNNPYKPYDEKYIKSKFTHNKDGRIYRIDNIGDYSKKSISDFRKQGKIYDYPSGKIGLIRYLDEAKGEAIGDMWTDILEINSQADERLGYPTQKPKELLERIIKASSNEGDLVADFFCGCGTTIDVAQELNRQWIGVDISHLAIRLIKDRLLAPYKKNKSKIKDILDSIEIRGLPKDIGSAKELAESTEGGRLEFQDWIIEVMLGGVSNIKKSADGGYDGYLTFGKSEKDKEIVLIEVKSGNVNVKNVREFIHVIDSRKAVIGAFVCFKDQITKPMEHEAKMKGYYDQKTWGQNYPKIQILSVEDILEGDGILIPESTKTTFKTAKFRSKKPSQEKLF